MTIRYLLDENVDLEYQAQLSRLASSLIVKVIGEPDVPPRRTTDPLILEWCEREDFMLVTNNRRTMPVHLADHLAAGRHVPGIIMLDDDQGLGANLEELQLMTGASLPGEWRDQIVYLPLRSERGES